MDLKIDGIFKTFLDQFFLGVLMVDKTSRIIYFNKRLGEIDELTPEDTLGYKISEAYSINEEESPAVMSLRSGQTVSKSMTYKTARGKQFTTLTHAYPVYHQREVIGAICVVMDVSSMTSATLPLTGVAKAKTKSPDEEPRIEFDSLIGKSPLFREAVDVARVAANGPSPVMLIGETGTGKDLFARAIHDYSVQDGGKYMAINCSAIPEALLEGILFGTAKGAFTGATDREGLFEYASGGTLFLDEINSMPLVLQAKLLRVLQDHRVRRVGGLSEKKVDLRIISASNINPLQAVANQGLRADLYYRLGVVQVRIPPLRERPEDIPYLARHFIDKINLKMGKNASGISDGLLQSLKRRSWPGNVRELEHVIESAMNFVSDGETLGERHFKRGNRHTEPLGQSLPSQAYPPITDHSDTLYLANKSFGKQNLFLEEGGSFYSSALGLSKAKPKWKEEQEERAKLVEALTLHRGIISRVAAYLGLSPQLTSYRMKKYKLKKDDFQT